MESLIAEQPELPKDLDLIFAGEKFSVSKFKLALFSPKMCQIFDKNEGKTLEFEEKTTLAIFKEFIKAVQGEEFELTQENALEMLRLAKKWEVTALIEPIEGFITDSGIEKKEITEQETSDEFIESLAKNMDKVIKVPSFADLPLNTLKKIVNHPSFKCEDNHSLFVFVINMLNLHGPEATHIALALDTTKLPSDDIIELLEHPNLDRKVFAPKLIPTAMFYVNATSKIESDFKGLQSCQVTSPNIVLKKVVENINHYQGEIDKLTDVQEDIESDIEELSILKKDIEETKTKLAAFAAKRDSMESESNAALQEISDRLETVKIASKECKRSPAKIVPIQEEVIPEKELKLTPVPFDVDPLDGIILTILELESPVTVTSSTCDHNDPSTVIKREGNDYWMSSNKADQWIRFDFGEKQVKVSSYTLATIKFGEDSCHMKSWILEGSNDDIEYTVIDKQDTDRLNGSNKVEVFKLEGETEPFKYLKIRSTGPNCRGDNTMALKGVEFFGDLVEC